MNMGKITFGTLRRKIDGNPNIGKEITFGTLRSTATAVTGRR